MIQLQSTGQVSVILYCSHCCAKLTAKRAAYRAWQFSITVKGTQIGSTWTDCLAQLSMENGHVVIVLSLIKVTCHWCAEIIFGSKGANLETSASLAAGLVYRNLVGTDSTGLFVNKDTVSMQTASLRWTGANVLDKFLASGQVVAGYVHYQPEVLTMLLMINNANEWNLPVQEFAEFWVSSAGGVRIR